MITIADLKNLQEALAAVLQKGVYLREALTHVLRFRQYGPAERAWLRDTLYRSVQLKNRYRTAIEAFAGDDPGRSKYAEDVRLFIVYHLQGCAEPSSMDRQVLTLLRDKSRIRKFRQFLRVHPDEKLFPQVGRHDPAWLWRYHSHPLWVVRKWLGVHGWGGTLEMCRFNNTLPDVILRINPLKDSRDEMVSALCAEGIQAEPLDLSPLGIKAGRKMDPLLHPAYRAGRFTLQSVASQLVCFYINPRSGERVLDYCAGEGGKTLLLAHIMKEKGEVHAHDQQIWRLQQLQQRLRREGVSNIRLPGLRALRKLAGNFDRVILDVPCSGSGNFRHQPELRWRLQVTDLDDFNRQQLALLDEAAPYCRPGGLLFYVTCSVFGEENHKVIRRFLSSRDGWALVPPAEFLATHHTRGFWLSAEQLATFTGERYFQTLPHPHHLSGMFCAVLRRSD